MHNVDSLGRTITYARISLTDACNFACPYCRPTGEAPGSVAPVLPVASWMRILRALSLLGVRALRLTGGEPLLYPGLEELLHRCHAEALFEDISLTTNASLLQHKADALRAAGLTRVNISLDGLTEERFQAQTGGRGRLSDVLAGIEAAVAAGLHPVKVNTVLTEALSEEEIQLFLSMMQRLPIVWRFIEYMPFQGDTYRGPTFDEWKETVERVAGARLVPTDAVSGFGPARYYRLPKGQVLGFIFPMSAPYCEGCNRIRITAAGQVRLCLLRPEEMSLADLAHEETPPTVLAERIAGFLGMKQAEHDGYDSVPVRPMWQIGG